MALSVVPRCRRRGRRPRVLTAVQRLQITQALQQDPRWGVARLRQRFPELPRNTTAIFVRAYKAARARNPRRPRCRLVRHVEGAVWAIDGTWMAGPVDGKSRRALVVVELKRRQVMALASVRGERVADVLALLRHLFARHGPPLVLKLDNGSAFIAEALRSFCQEHGIVLMHSPVRLRGWNGTCEVSGRWAKARAAAAAVARGNTTLSQCDLDAAVTVKDSLAPVDEDLRDRFGVAFARERLLRAAELGLAFAQRLEDHVRRSLERVAARRALQKCHILTIEGRELSQWLPVSSA